MYLYDGGIQSVVYKKQDSQLDFYKKINAITMQDSLLKELSTKKSETEVIQETPVEPQPIQPSSKRVSV